NPEEVFAAYDGSGTDCMMLQEGIEFEDYFRCYGVGQRDVLVMRYNPGAANSQARYEEVDRSPIPPKMLKRVEKDVLALCRALGYDLNTVEFAVRDGIPYAIDFMNPAPDADYHSVGLDSYKWVVETVGKFLVEKARSTAGVRQFSANGYLEPSEAE
ncbi:MAG: hypothetical protein HKN13_09340, partial [Rhodothermales bacterium]|nr:hypothetical protein [Rhodothermales bacterium]